MINIIGGRFKKKKIKVPLSDVRPTSSLKKEAIFSFLESQALKNSYELYNETCFIDLFAGSGSLGLEAISRGASFAYFYEINSKVFKILSENCNSICKSNQYSIHLQDCKLLKSINTNYLVSTVFIDPPYRETDFQSIFNLISNSNILDNPNATIVIETSKKTNLKIPNYLKKINEKIYRGTKITYLKIL